MRPLYAAVLKVFKISAKAKQYLYNGGSNNKIQTLEAI